MARKSIFAHWDGYEFAYRIRHDGDQPLRPVLDEIAGVLEGAVLIVGGDSPEHSLRIDDPLVGALTYSETLVGEIEQHSGMAIVARSQADIDRARAADIPWFLLGIEGCRPLRGSM